MAIQFKAENIDILRDLVDVLVGLKEALSDSKKLKNLISEFDNLQDLIDDKDSILDAKNNTSKLAVKAEKALDEAKAISADLALRESKLASDKLDLKTMTAVYNINVATATGIQSDASKQLALSIAAKLASDDSRVKADQIIAENKAKSDELDSKIAEFNAKLNNLKVV